jgi:CubicO group peptidase (beta-lactamase class C family)
MRFRIWLSPLLLTCLIAVASAEDPLSGLPAAMEVELANHHAAGVVVLVLQDGRVVHQSAAGYASLETRAPMQVDSIFWIASMTKSISATAIMTLVDEGRLSLDEPASNWLPALGKVRLANGQPPARPITLRDLLSHTSGLAFPPRKATDGVHSLASYTDELVKAPLSFEPGSAYEYGFGITVAGRIAEIVSGQPFEDFVQQRILDPLEMRDTAFFPDDRLRERFARTYRTADDGSRLAATYNPFVMPAADIRRGTEPSGGMFSTAADMAKFYQMILDGGVAGGRRIVSKASIAEMTRPHTAGGKPLNYGLGWQCSPPGKASISGFSEQAFGHGGAFGTHGWIDPAHRIVAVFMVQNALVQGGGAPRQVFHQHVTRALIPAKEESAN